MMLEDFTHLGTLTCTPQQQKPDGCCPYDTGAAYVQTMGLDMGVTQCFLVLLLIYCILRVWGLLCLIQITRQSKN